MALCICAVHGVRVSRQGHRVGAGGQTCALPGVPKALGLCLPLVKDMDTPASVPETHLSALHPSRWSGAASKDAPILISSKPSPPCLVMWKRTECSSPACRCVRW